MNGNNTVGKNSPAPEKLRDDVHFDLAPTAGIVVVAGVTGVTYTVADLKAIILANGATYEADGSAFVIGDDLIECEVDVQFIGGKGIDEGDTANGVTTSTTESAMYENNGSWSFINAGGGRQDGEDGVGNLPTSFTSIHVENGTVVTVHNTFQKA